MISSALLRAGRTLRQTARSLRSAPSLAAAVVVTFALGIGATTATYSVVHHVLLRPLPYPDPDRLVGVWTRMPDAGIAQLDVAHAEYLDYRAESRLIADAGAYYSRAVVLTGAGEPTKLHASMTTASLFSVLGVPPRLGRCFTPADDRRESEPTVLLGDSLWRSAFGADASIVGRSVDLDGVSRRVIGVMPASFRFPDPGAQLWVPYPLDPDRRDNHHLTVIARMRPGVALGQLQPEMDAIVAGWAQSYTHAHPMFALDFRDQVLGAVRTPLALLLAAVVLVLLVAAANVAGLLLARSESRRRELAVRASLGAGRRHLVAEVLRESLALAALGGVLGVALAKLALLALAALPPAGLPRLDEVALDLPVLAMALALTVVSGVVAGIVPALRAARPDVAGILRGAGERLASGGGRERFRAVLVAGETALAVVLVASASLVVRSLALLGHVDTGLRPDHVLTGQLALPATRYSGAPEVAAFYDRLLERTGALPGVTSTALVNTLPMRDTIRMILVSGAWQPPGAEPVGADATMVTPSYFATLGNRVLRGRPFTEADRPGAARVAALNETAARVLFGDRDPIGSVLTISQAEPRVPGFEVVAVVRDVPTQGPGIDVRAQVYLPLHQALVSIRGVTRAVSVALRTDGDPAALAATLRTAIRELDPDLAVSNLETMDDVVAASLAPQRFQSVLTSAFAALALALAAVGLYGLLAHAVGLRRHELGVRLALGAHPVRLVALVLRQGLAVTAVGLVAGTAGAVLAGRAMRSVLYGVSPWDPTSLAVTASVLLATTLLAGTLPARRAARLDPAATLRGD